jgi:hypothetical protein
MKKVVGGTTALSIEFLIPLDIARRVRSRGDEEVGEGRKLLPFQRSRVQLQTKDSVLATFFREWTVQVLSSPSSEENYVW